MSTELTPIKVINYTSNPTGTSEAGFVAIYIKDDWLYKKDSSAVITDMVLDRPLDNFVAIPYTPIVPTDTILEALQKIQRFIYNDIAGNNVAVVSTGTYILFGFSLLNTNYTINIRCYNAVGDNLDYNIPPAEKTVAGFKIIPTDNGFIDFICKKIY